MPKRKKGTRYVFILWSFCLIILKAPLGFVLKWSGSEKNVKVKYYFLVQNDEL
jgi:hypothetical protein